MYMYVPSLEMLNTPGKQASATQWYTCLLLQGRHLSPHEVAQLRSASVPYLYRETGRGSIISCTAATALYRPMCVELTHYHSIQALLAMYVLYVDRTAKGGYPERHVE